MFWRSFAAAVTDGQFPESSAGLGPVTLSAIEAIARKHPDAPPRLIVDAHDAFFREHVDKKAPVERITSVGAIYTRAAWGPHHRQRSNAG
jgi:hypothetical protein